MFRVGDIARLKNLGNKKLRQAIRHSNVEHRRMAVRLYRKLKLTEMKVEEVYKEKRMISARLPDGDLLCIPFEALMPANFRDAFNKLGEE